MSSDASSQLQGLWFDPELVLRPPPKTHARRQSGDSELPLGVNACVYGAMVWTDVP